MTETDVTKRGYAVDKSVALVTDVAGAMDHPCPVCRGGWWHVDEVLAYAVHASGCPWANKHPEAKK